MLETWSWDYVHFVVGVSVGVSVVIGSPQIGAVPIHIGFSGSYFSSVSKVS